LFLFDGTDVVQKAFTIMFGNIQTPQLQFLNIEHVIHTAFQIAVDVV